jgi:hypothetical protein
MWNSHWGLIFRPEQKLRWIDNFRWTARSAQHLNSRYTFAYGRTVVFKKRSEGMPLQEDSTIGDGVGWFQKEANAL